MVDNFNLIRSLLTFDGEDDFYYTQLIQRKKETKTVHSPMTGFSAWVHSILSIKCVRFCMLSKRPGRWYSFLTKF